MKHHTEGNVFLGPKDSQPLSAGCFGLTRTNLAQQAPLEHADAARGRPDYLAHLDSLAPKQRCKLLEHRRIDQPVRAREHPARLGGFTTREAQRAEEGV